MESTNNANFPQEGTTTTHQPNPAHAHAHAIFNFLTYTVGPSPNRSANCAICLEELLPTQNSITHTGAPILSSTPGLGCNNALHETCFEEFLWQFIQSRRNLRPGCCPFCRGALPITAEYLASLDILSAYERIDSVNLRETLTLTDSDVASVLREARTDPTSRDTGRMDRLDRFMRTWELIRGVPSAPLGRGRVVEVPDAIRESQWMPRRE